jgi:hypothetical protein
MLALQISWEENEAMKTFLGQMDGNMWEDYCQKLLKQCYEDYQEVPSQFGGDYGIEGFTRSGLVFQCYCPDEDPSGKDLYEYQRDKITKEIKKFIKNATKISALGAGIIREWHFLTPRYNSRHLVSHCRTKESEVRSKSLKTVQSGFTIWLKTEDDYISERQTLLGTSGLRVQPSGEEPPIEELEKLLTSDNEIVSNIKTKLQKLALATNQRANLTEQLVGGYVVGQDELETLNKQVPSTYKSVIQLKSATQSQLAIRTLSCPNNHGTILKEILKEYEDKLSTNFSGSLSSALIVRLSTEAISDWLGRCPLDFPDLEGTDENY